MWLKCGMATPRNVGRGEIVKVKTDRDDGRLPLVPQSAEPQPKAAAFVLTQRAQRSFRPQAKETANRR
jgi:hypothetical protein